MISFHVVRSFCLFRPRSLSLCLSLPAIRMIAPHWIGDVEITNNNLLPLYEIITAFYHDMNSK